MHGPKHDVGFQDTVLGNWGHIITHDYTRGYGLPLVSACTENQLGWARWCELRFYVGGAVTVLDIPILQVVQLGIPSRRMEPAEPLGQAAG